MTNLFLIVFGRVISVVISLVMGKVLTTMMPMDDVGIVLTFSSSCVLIAYTLISPIGQYINRNTHHFTDNGFWPSVFKQYNRYLLLISLPTFAFFYLFFKLNSAEVDNPFIFALLVVLFVYFSTWNQTIPPALNLIGKIREFVTLSSVSQLLYFGFSLVFVLVYQNSAFYWIAGGLLGYAISFLINGFLFKKGLILRAEKEEKFVVNKKEIFNFSAPIAFASTLTWIQTHSYRIFLLSLFGSAITAKVGVFMALGLNLMASLEIIMSQLLYPKFYKNISVVGTENRSSSWSELFDKTAMVYISALFLGIGATPFLTRLLTGEAFFEFHYLLFFALVAEFLRIVFNLFTLRALAELSTAKLIPPQLLATGILIIGFAVIYAFDFTQLYAVPILILVANLGALLMSHRSLKAHFELNIHFTKLFKRVLISLPYLGLYWPWNLENRTYFYFLLVIAIGHFIWVNKDVLQEKFPTNP